MWGTGKTLYETTLEDGADFVLSDIEKVLDMLQKFLLNLYRKMILNVLLIKLGFLRQSQRSRDVRKFKH